MERILYQEIYNKISKLKSITTLGAFVTFLHQEIIKGHSDLKYDAVSDRTLERGFKAYLEPEILQKFKRLHREKQEQKMEKPYEPSLKTLNLLAEYLGHKDYAAFSYFIQVKTEKDSIPNENSSKISITVNQFGKENTNIGEIKTDNLYL